MKLDLVQNLSLQDLMALRVAVTNEVNLREDAANTALLNGHTYAGYAMKPGKLSRTIVDQKEYEVIIGNALGDNSYKIVPLSLTAAEKLIKKQFDDEDAIEILEEMKATYGQKVGKPTLVYTGEFNE